MNTASNGPPSAGTSSGAAEGVDLPPVGVALDRDVEQAERRRGQRARLRRQQDQARAGPQHRLALHEGLERRAQPGRVQQPQHGGGLAARHDQRLEAREVLRPRDAHRLRPERGERHAVALEVALQAQHSDPGTRHSVTSPASPAARRPGWTRPRCPSWPSGAPPRAAPGSRACRSSRPPGRWPAPCAAARGAAPRA